MSLKTVASGLIDGGTTPAFVTGGNIGFNATITRASAGKISLKFDKPFGTNEINIIATVAENIASPTVTVNRPSGDPTTVTIWTDIAGTFTDLDLNVLAVSHI